MMVSQDIICITQHYPTPFSQAYPVSPQQDQLYTWAAVSQPPHSAEHFDGRVPGRIQTLWPPPKPGGEERPGLKYTEAGKVDPPAQRLLPEQTS